MKYTRKQIMESIKYWQKQLKLGNYKKLNESSGKHAYLDIILPKNGVSLHDDAGKKLDFGIKLNNGMASGWSGIDQDGNIVCLSDFESGYDGTDISIPLLAKFLADYGYELVDER